MVELRDASFAADPLIIAQAPHDTQIGLVLTSADNCLAVAAVKRIVVNVRTRATVYCRQKKPANTAFRRNSPGANAKAIRICELVIDLSC
jgi:hypothetical protein